MATFLVARTGLAGVDEWQAERVAQIGRIKARGESIASIAALANISETEVRSYLKAASAAGRAQGGAAAVAPAQPLD